MSLSMIQCILQLYLSLGTGENGLQCEAVVGTILPKYFFPLTLFRMGLASILIQSGGPMCYYAFFGGRCALIHEFWMSLEDF